MIPGMIVLEDLEALPRIPVTSASEENLLCYGQRQDRWFEEDLLVHEFAHSVHSLGMNKVNATWERRLQEAFDKAMEKKLWRSTYAMANIKEYFAEGVQKFFNVDTHRDFIDGVHNNISTRETLMGYDKELFDLVSEVFPCANTIIKRCQDQSKSKLIYCAFCRFVQYSCSCSTSLNSEVGHSDFPGK